MAIFNFCPTGTVPETLPRDAPQTAMTMNGWQFAARPTTPYQRKFKLTLYGLRWFIRETDGSFDTTTQTSINARLLELFYQEHETWKPFTYRHQHFGDLECRFATPLIVPAGMPNSNGLIKSVEATLIEHNPGY
jgi:hypothetical protein